MEVAGVRTRGERLAALPPVLGTLPLLYGSGKSDRMAATREETRVIGFSLIARASDWLRHVKRRRVWAHDLAQGRRGEDLAHRYLRRHKFTIVARNYRL